MVLFDPILADLFEPAAEGLVLGDRGFKMSGCLVLTRIFEVDFVGDDNEFNLRRWMVYSWEYFLEDRLATICLHKLPSYDETFVFFLKKFHHFSTDDYEVHILDQFLLEHMVKWTRLVRVKSSLIGILQNVEIKWLWWLTCAELRVFALRHMILDVCFPLLQEQCRQQIKRLLLIFIHLFHFEVECLELPDLAL